MKFLLVLLLLCSPQSPEPNVSKEYDRFKNTTTLSTPYEFIRFDAAANREIRSVQMRWITSYRGQVLKESPRLVTVGFSFISYEWQFIRSTQPSFIILVDGKKILDGNVSHIASDPKTGYVSEIYAAQIDLSLAKQIAEAKVAEIQIGTVELSVTPNAQSSLRELLTHASR